MINDASQQVKKKTRMKSDVIVEFHVDNIMIFFCYVSYLLPLNPEFATPHPVGRPGIFSSPKADALNFLSPTARV